MSVFILYKVLNQDLKKGRSSQPASTDVWVCPSPSTCSQSASPPAQPLHPELFLEDFLSLSINNRDRWRLLEYFASKGHFFPFLRLTLMVQGGSQRFLLEFLPWDSDRKEEKFMVNQALSGNTTHVSVFLATLLHSSEPSSITESTALFLQSVKPRSSSVQWLVPWLQLLGSRDGDYLNPFSNSSCSEKQKREIKKKNIWMLFAQDILLVSFPGR